MIADFRNTDSPLEYQTDVCVVGAGAAGITLALSLAANSKLNAIVVESGSLEIEPMPQTLSRGESTGLAFRGMSDGRARALGGATRLWYGQCVRLEPIDFEKRDWVPHSGWPITARDLAPWYTQADALFQVETGDLGNSVYSNFPVEAPLWDPTRLETHCTVYSPIVDFGSIFQSRLRENPRLRVLLNATVVQVEVNEQANVATGVRIRSLNGRCGRIAARFTVLCGGGIENPRLLLASNEVASQGLGNDNDLVGRFFQDHPNGFTATIDEHHAPDLQRRFSLLYRKKLRFFPKFSLSPALQRTKQTLNSSSHLFFDCEPDTPLESFREFGRALRRGKLPHNPARHACRLLTGAPEVCGAAWSLARGVSPTAKLRQIRLQTFLEQAPHESSRVRLGATRDPLGIPQACLHWHLTSLEQKTAVESARAFAVEFERLRLGRARIEEWLPDPDWADHFNDAFHHIGTTRMGSNSREGVVDTNLQVFGVGGLYVAGSSAFPTSGWANPTLTIAALSLRLSSYLARV